MLPQLISREIKVAVSPGVQEPLSFRLGEREYIIAEILASWADHGFGQAPLRRRKWWQRHHRNYYRVKTTEGEVFEIYFDRGTNLKHPERRKWYLHRQL